MPRKYGKKASTASKVTEAPTSAIQLVNFTEPVSRWLFQPLYEAVLQQALAMGDSEVAVKAKFASLLLGDPNHGFIAEIVGDKIQSHCLYRLDTQNGVIVIEQFVGSIEFIQTVQQSFETEMKPNKIVYSVNEENVDYFIDELGYEVDKVLITKSFTQEE